MPTHNLKQTPPQEELKRLFLYKDGRLLRRGIKGMPPRKFTSCGYTSLRIGGVSYLEHRLIWVLHNGPIQDGLYIDHLNRSRGDNRIENLRLVSPAENTKNITLRKDNTSGVNGVRWNAWAKKWHARIGVDGVKLHLGYFLDIELAKQAILSAQIKYGFASGHGES